MGRSSKRGLKGLREAFDEATFGPDKTLNLRESLPSGIEARSRAESWLRAKQVSGGGDVLIVTGRGNQSPGGVGIVRESVLALLPFLRRRGVVESWREHTAGSVVVTLAPVTQLLTAPSRKRDSQADRPLPVTPDNLAALDGETLRLLRLLATRTIESLGISHGEQFLEEEMRRAFEMLSATLPLSADREGMLRRAIEAAIEELDE
ncbi:MAG TPA: hypothetical protein VIF83_11450 [Gemmatimonadaceae bacterium]